MLDEVNKTNLKHEENKENLSALSHIFRINLYWLFAVNRGWFSKILKTITWDDYYLESLISLLFYHKTKSRQMQSK